MGDAARDLELRIRTTGADAAAGDLGKIGTAGANAEKALHGTATATKGLGDELAGLGSRHAASRELLDGLERASNGGATAVFGLGRAFKGFLEILENATPLGRIIQLLALLTAGGAIVYEKFFAPATKGAEELKTAEDEAVKKTKELLAEADRLNNLSVESSVSEIAKLTAGMKEAEVVAVNLRKAEDALQNADMAAELQGVEAQKEKEMEASKSPQTIQETNLRAQARELEIRNRYALKKAEAEANRAGGDVSLTQGALDITQKQLDIAAQPRIRANLELRKARTEIADRSDQERITKEHAELAALGLNRTPEQETRFTELSGQVDAAQSSIDDGNETFKQARADAVRQKSPQTVKQLDEYDMEQQRALKAAQSSAKLEEELQGQRAALKQKLALQLSLADAANQNLGTARAAGKTAERTIGAITGQANSIQQDHTTALVGEGDDAVATPEDGATEVNKALPGPSANPAMNRGAVSRDDFFKGIPGGGMRERAIAPDNTVGMRGRSQPILDTKDAFAAGKVSGLERRARKAGVSEDKISDARSSGNELEVLKGILAELKNKKGSTWEQ